MKGVAVGVRTWIEGWPVYRQVTGADSFGRGAAVQSQVSAGLTARTATADKVVKSVCPYCAVGCGQNVYVKGGVEGGEVGVDVGDDRDGLAHARNISIDRCLFNRYM